MHTNIFPHDGFRHPKSVKMSMSLPMDLVQPGEKGAVWGDRGRLIHPEMEGGRADDTLRSPISIYFPDLM